MSIVFLIANIHILIYTGKWVGAEDPCSVEIYSQLPRAEYRGGACAYNEEKPTCDATLKPGWYRAFGPSGNLKLQETAADLFTCGTKFSIWMEGPHPDVDDGEVNRTLLQAAPGQTRIIQVKNCNDEYFVYKLEPTSTCTEAYCFGGTDIDPCPPFDPCDVYEHELVSYDPGRSGHCIIADVNSCNRDTYSQSWVVFRDSDQDFLTISRSPLHAGACGSVSPMWIKETMSTNSTGIKTETVCISSQNDDCSTTSVIRSKECLWFTVYEAPFNVTCGRLCLDDPDASCAEHSSPLDETAAQPTDPCSDQVYQELPRADYRGGDCAYDDQKPTCDAALTTDWYRAVGANGNLKMQETSAEIFECGTKFPIRLNGTHPTTADGEVEMTLLQAFTNRTMSTTVKNCNDEYFVYYLRPTGSCPEAYCFGITDKDPCPPFDPCDIYEHQTMGYDKGRSSDCLTLNEDSCVRESYDLSWVVFRDSNGGFLNATRTPSGVGACGSRAPMWIKEKLSTAPDGIKTEKVCIESKNDDCASDLTMRSKTCLWFTVYEPPADEICSRLCLDDPEPSCPDETTTPYENPRKPPVGDQGNDTSSTKGSKESLWIIAAVLAVVIALAGVMVTVCIWRHRNPVKKRTKPYKVHVASASVHDSVYDKPRFME